MAKSSENGQLTDPETGEKARRSRTWSTECWAPRLAGTEEQLCFDLGSEYQLSDSTLKLIQVPSMSVDGQYREGDRIKVILEIEVEYVAFPPIKDRGFRVGTERRHFGQVMSAAPAEEELRANSETHCRPPMARSSLPLRSLSGALRAHVVRLPTAPRPASSPKGGARACALRQRRTCARPAVGAGLQPTRLR